MPPKRRARSLTGRKEKTSNKERAERHRSLPSSQEQHRIRNAESMRVRRAIQDIREEEQARDTVSRRTRRSVASLREQENERNAERMSDVRQVQERREEENERNATRMSNVRQDQERREQENIREAQRKNIVRQDQERREEENERNAARMSNVRQDQERREEENERNADRMSLARLDPVYRENEQRADTSRKRKKAQQKRKWDEAYSEYNEEIRDGPYHTCASCDQNFFSKQVVTKSKQLLLERGKTEQYLEILICEEYINNLEYIFCNTCWNTIRMPGEKFPRLNINNSWLRFPDVASIVTNLTALEERCVAARIGFMKLQALGCDQQFGLKSGLVNVPVDVRKTLKSIPALPNFSGTVELEFMRSMKFKKFTWKERVRPQELYNAAVELSTKELYMKEGITVDLNWNYNENAEITIDFDPNKDNIPNTVMHNVDVTNDEAEELAILEQALQDNPNEFNEWRRGQIEREIFTPDERQEMEKIRQENLGYIGEETLLDCAYGVRFAPGEGQRPLPILMDENCEELMFPRVWGGISRKVNPGIKPKLNYEEICKSEIRRSDRRCVRPDVLFFKYKKTQIKQLLSQTNMCFRRTAQGMNITAEQALDSGFMAGLVIDDNIFRFASSIVGSPAYFERVKKDVLAMIRQLNCPTLFMTLSAAETHWNELLVMLKKVLDKKIINEVQAEEMTFEEKARLIRNDPVTCALYFNYRFRKVIQLIKGTSDGPFGKYNVEDIFFRIEFQHRGSPHVHMVIWLKNAPRLELDDNDEFKEESINNVLTFIDEFITTDSDDPDLQNLIYTQRHKCRRQCMRYIKGTEVCRFGFPLPPMDQTRILQPIPDEAKKALEQNTKNKINNIHKCMNDILLKESQTIENLDTFLQKLNCSMDEYIFAIRYPLKHAKIYLKRSVKNCSINAYNKKVLLAMRSNMDIQYIIDPYACVGYVVDYINKSQRGLSRLLRQVAEDFCKGNHTLREKLKAISNVLFNSTEISAQEAAWVRCQLAMTSTSCAVEFINSGPIEKRHKMLKTNKELQELKERDPLSTDILKKGPIDRYALRPDELEDKCLAEFIAEFNFQGKSSDDANLGEVAAEEIEDFHDDYDDDVNAPRNLKTFQLKEDAGKIKERRRPKIIRYCRFSIHKEPEQHFREMIMLFLPWREEITEGDYEEIFKQNLEEIQENYNKFNKIKVDLNEIYNEINLEREAEEQEMEGNPENQQREMDEQEEYQRMITNVYDFDEVVIQPNVAFEMGMDDNENVDEVTRYKVPNLLSKEEVQHLCNTLNKSQHKYLMNLIHLFKSKSPPFYHYIAGGAGVGKSLLIKSIFQIVTRYFRTDDAGPADTVEVLLVAFTGAAAHNINGMTCHAAFHLSTTEGTTKFKNLRDETINTIKAQLRGLKLLIIDEISMLSSDHLMEIDARLKEIFVPDQDFGGIPVIAVGDFHQLRPVGANYVFKETATKNAMRIVLGNTLWPLFKIFELTEIMRQREDKSFSEMLQRVSEYKQTPDDMKMLESRVYNEDSLPEAGMNAVRLVPAQKDVRTYNLKCIERMLNPDGSKPKCFTYHAIDKFIGSGITKSQRDRAQFMLQQYHDDCQHKKTKNLPKVIDFMIGLKYMVSSNIETSDGLYNGAVGILKFIEDDGRNGIKAVWLEFSQPEVGAQARSRRKAIMDANPHIIMPNWTPIEPAKLTFKVTKHRITVCRMQFPLLIAEAWTYHKSQGQSLKYVTAKLNSETKMTVSLPMFYVGISRATSLNGLHMVATLPLRIPKPTEDSLTAVRELERMREDCQLDFKFEGLLKESHPEYLQVASFNIQSIRANIDIFKCDGVFKATDIIALQETWAKSNEQYEIPNMVEVIRNKINRGSERGRGTIIYAKSNKLPLSGIKCSEHEFGTRRIEITSCIVNNIRLINIYRSPDQSLHPSDLEKALKDFESFLNEPNVLLFGDFNYKLNEPCDLDLFLENKYNLKLFSPREATTDRGTTIDAVYGRLTNFTQKSIIYESYVSYHKPIVIQLKHN